MGYSTDFRGELHLSPILTPAQAAYLDAFAGSRRVRRDARKAALLPDPLREAVGLPIGKQGGYFVNGFGLAGQDTDPSVLDGNEPPEGQPGLRCQWETADAGAVVCWDQGEKFYDYAHWLAYLLDHFLTPWGIVASGVIEWRGEEWEDTGALDVRDNVLTVRERGLTWVATAPRPVGVAS